MSKLSKWLNPLIKYTAAAIVLMVPLYPKFPFLKVPGTFVSIRLEDLLLAFAAGLLSVVIIQNFTNFIKDRITLSILLFISVGLVSLLSAIFITQTVEIHIGFLHWARRIEYFVPLFLGLETIRRDRSNLDFFMKILLIVTIVSFIYGLGQRYAEWPVIITQNEEYSKGVALRWAPGSHINATFAGHYDLSTFLVIVLPLFITLFFLAKGRYTKVILLVGIFGGLWLLVNSASRISLVSYLGATTLALLLARKYGMIPIVLVVSLLFVGFSSNLISRYTRIIEVTLMELQTYRLSSNTVYASDSLIPRTIVTPSPTPPPVFEDRSTNIRLNVEWPRAIRAFTKNSLLGTGYSSITLATDNHYLRLLGEIGLLGLLSFIMIWSQIGLELLKVFPYAKRYSGLELAYICGMTGAIAGVFVNAIFIDVFEASKFIILYMFCIGMLIALARKEHA